MAGSKQAGEGPRIPVQCAIQHQHGPNATVLFVSGTVDAMTAPQLALALASSDHHINRFLVVDLTAVDFLSATGIGLLYQAHQELTHLTRLVIVVDGPRTSRPLKLVGVADVVDVYPTLAEALAAVAPRPSVADFVTLEPHCELL